MLKSYFFVPADRSDFIQKAFSYYSDNLIFDLEDSISSESYQFAVENLRKIDNQAKYFLRTRFFKEKNNSLDTVRINDGLKLGFTKFVIPKIESVQEIKQLEGFLTARGNTTSLEFIFLVESPKALIQLKDLILATKLNLIAIGFGSHDYCSELNMKHELDNLKFARQYILNIAKAYGLDAIDIASMNITDENSFQEELRSAFDLGFDSKFIIHPMQLEQLYSTRFYSDTEIENAKLAYSKLKKADLEKFGVLRVNDNLYEKPHIKRIISIINEAKRFEKN